ncbi:NmrA family transcriptional regulator [Microtetraspora sp. NBRC 13810]|uniref:NmrA/HSCARG family protein n=1 Tax=Microtetraspora sp. NBRC 13810 TaxID=3030990 RepID=UPI0024A10313|nr:NmrA/HSCARG family protein [Microtetraspora sp. NBRC 13810]GLW05757.1 NmrA family transcriptional regulator [Microtetraspora sp. NBRC 13810]
MNPVRKPVLVTGVTGRQGGATAAQLLAAGLPVRALVRDPAAPAARAWLARGAELRAGDLDDPRSLAEAAAGSHGIFGVTPDDEDTEREIRRGRNLADAAAAAGVSHFVFASVGGAERGSGLPYWESKRRIEEYVHALGLPATILRPVRFMENHTVPGLPVGGIAGGELRHLFGPETPVQLIAVTDIGVFARLAFTRPEEYAGQAIEIAGDELTPSRTVELISRAVGREITYRQVADYGAGLSAQAKRLFADERGVWRADIAALRARHPGLLDFPAWLRNGGAAEIRALLARER